MIIKKLTNPYYYMNFDYNEELEYLIDRIIEYSPKCEDVRDYLGRIFTREILYDFLPFHIAFNYLLKMIPQRYDIEQRIASFPRGELKSYIDKTKYKLQNGDERICESEHYYLIYDRKKHYVKRKDVNRIEKDIAKRKAWEPLLDSAILGIEAGTQIFASEIGIHIDPEEIYEDYSYYVSHSNDSPQKHSRWIVEYIEECLYQR